MVKGRNNTLHASRSAKLNVDHADVTMLRLRQMLHGLVHHYQSVLVSVFALEIGAIPLTGRIEVDETLSSLVLMLDVRLAFDARAAAR